MSEQTFIRHPDPVTDRWGHQEDEGLPPVEVRAARLKAQMEALGMNKPKAPREPTTAEIERADAAVRGLIGGLL